MGRAQQTPLRRRCALLVAGVLALGGAVVGIGQAPVAVAEEAVTPVESLGACIAAGGTAEILLLVDTSSSLVSSDPESARVTAANYFVGQLAESAAAADAAPVEVQLSTFAHDFQTITDWTGLNPSTVSGVQSDISTLADNVNGFDTDYWAALDGARNALAAKRGSGNAAEHCQSIVIFSDGKLDISPRLTDAERTAYGVEKPYAPGVQATTPESAQQLVDAARADLCRDGGVADQLTASGITLFGIGLSPTDAQAVDFDVLESLSVGTSQQGTTCGAAIEPPRGEFYLANDIDGLLLAFDAISDPGNPPISQTAGVCQVVFCEDRSHRFVLDASTPDVRLLASADLAGLEAALLTPTGELIPLKPSSPGTTTPLASTSVEGSYSWESGKTISVTASPSNGSEAKWTGLWQFAFIDPSGQSDGAQSRSNLHISSSLAPAVLAGIDDKVHAGDRIEGISLGIVDADAQSFDAGSILGKLNYQAVFEDSAGTTTELLSTETAGDIAAPVVLDLGQAAIGEGKIVLRLVITTAAVTLADGTTYEGTTLEPTVVSIPIQVAPPLTFPQIGSEVRFDPATGPAEVSATLETSGSGCVWIDPEASVTLVTQPDGIGEVSITSGDATSAETCAPASADGQLPLLLTTQEGGNGSLHGTFPVTLQAADGQGEPIVVDVRFTAEMQKPLNTTNFLLVAIAGVVLGLGLPVLLLALAKALVARIPAKSLVAAAIPVRVQAGEVLRDGARFGLGPGDLTGTVAIPSKGTRRLSAAGITLIAKPGFALTSAGHVLVEAQGRSTASGAHPSTDSSGLRARLPLAIHGNWVVAHAPGGPGEDAEVIVLVGGTASPAERQTLEEDINRRLPGIFEKLRNAEVAAGLSHGGGDGFAMAGGPHTPPWMNGQPAATRDDSFDVFGGEFGGSGNRS